MLCSPRFVPCVLDSLKLLLLFHGTTQPQPTQTPPAVVVGLVGYHQSQPLEGVHSADMAAGDMAGL